MIENFTIYTKMLEVIAWTFQKVNTLPKKQRFVLGQQIENTTLACLRLIIEANNASRTSDKLLKLDELNIELEMLRSLLRVAQQLNFMSAKSLGYIIGQIDEIGRMRGGWAKRYHKQ
ncbi:MAG: diversity-generating retroelement protein Avd [Candidatus Saccharimonadales bacterium]